MIEYPDSDDLRKIEHWEIKDFSDCHSLMQFVFLIWAYPERCIILPNGTYRLSTGGWSGNEDIISSMQKNVLFWALFWESSNRAGGHTFGEPSTRSAV